MLLLRIKKNFIFFQKMFKCLSMSAWLLLHFKMLWWDSACVTHAHDPETCFSHPLVNIEFIAATILFLSKKLKKNNKN